MVDIVIPVLNEEKILSEKREYYTALKKKARVIFVDGGSTDRTVELARNYGEVVCSKAGRAIQKNHGARQTQSEHILFLHADSFIDTDALQQVTKALSNGNVGGCFTMRIEDQRFIFRIYEHIVNFRARTFGVMDGDLGLFVHRERFEELGRFHRLPIMEDLVFSKKLRKTGKIEALPNPIYVSSRKWHENGFAKTFLAYTLAYIQLWTGIPFFKHKYVKEQQKDCISYIRT